MWKFVPLEQPQFDAPVRAGVTMQAVELHSCLTVSREFWDVFWTPPKSTFAFLSHILSSASVTLQPDTPATTPRLETIYLISSHSLWPIPIKPRSSETPYVTVLDVCRCIYRHFNMNMAEEEFNALEKKEKDSVLESYRRSRTDLEEVKGPALLRGDYLQGRTAFGGLTHATLELMQRRGGYEIPYVFQLDLGIPHT